MDRTHRGVPFERYADDIVIHCTRMSEAVRIRESLTQRMGEVGLTINEEKSKIVYIDIFERHNVATSFTFLGYEFKVRIPRPSGHLFHEHPATDSTVIRPPVPRSSGHP
jgi:RNA-directed DNA polymerase